MSAPFETSPAASARKLNWPAPFVPKTLLNQLKIGGRLVIPVGENTQVMTLYIRASEKKFNMNEYGEFQFVPLLKEKE